MVHRAYTETGTKDAFGNDKRKLAFSKKAFAGRSPADHGGAAHRAAVREGTPVNTLSIPSAMGDTVPYQVATGEQVRAAFGVVLHHVPLTKAADVTPAKPSPAKTVRTPKTGVRVPRPAKDVRLNRDDAIERCPFTTEPLNVCYCCN